MAFSDCLRTYQYYAPLPPPGICRGKGGHLTCFDAKICPIRGEFDRSPYARATIKSANSQIPHLFLDC